MEFERCCGKRIDSTPLPRAHPRPYPRKSSQSGVSSAQRPQNATTCGGEGGAGGAQGCGVQGTLAGRVRLALCGELF